MAGAPSRPLLSLSSLLSSLDSPPVASKKVREGSIPVGIENGSRGVHPLCVALETNGEGGPSPCCVEKSEGGVHPPRNRCRRDSALPLSHRTEVGRVKPSLRSCHVASDTKKKDKKRQVHLRARLFCCPPSCLLFVYVLPSSSFMGRAMWMDGGGRGRGRGGGGGGGWKRNALMSWQIVVPFSAALLTLSYGYHFEKNAPAPAPVPN